MNPNGAKLKIYIDGVELLKSEYTYTNYEDNTKGYTRKQGRITFTLHPPTGKAIKIDYELAPDLLTAQDRV